MITLVIPTRNRAHTLCKVAESYFQQDAVSEIIFVSDAGEDDSEQIILGLAAKYPAVSTRFLRNAVRKGAAETRNVGIQNARNDYILFCDDDEYLEAGYAATCLAKLQQYGAGAVSGRRVYMLDGETMAEAKARFGNGMRNAPPFRYLIGEYVNGARYEGDVALPYTNAIILTKREYLLAHPFDPYYSRGNGYREESDYQMSLFVSGLPIYATNDTHSFHLPMSQVKTGGQRTQPWRRVYWSTHYTNYFYKKYYAVYARKVGLHLPRVLAVAAFACFALYRETLRPPLYALAMRLIRLKNRG